MEGSFTLVDKKNSKAYPTSVLLSSKMLEVVSHQIRQKIMESLAKSEKYPREIAEKLNIDEQLIYYHIRILEKHGIVKRKHAQFRGSPAFFSLNKVAYAYIPSYVKPTEEQVSIHDHLKIPRILEGFISNGKINCKLIVGDTNPHGKFQTSGRAIHHVGEISAILGRYGTATDRICFTDTQIQKVEENFIVISGFIINTIQGMFNEHSPLRFDEEGKKIISTISKKEYEGREYGLICKFPNPFSKDKWILIIAGVGIPGTEAAIDAVIKHMDRIEEGNRYRRAAIANVVRYKGKTKDIEFLE